MPPTQLEDRWARSGRPSVVAAFLCLLGCDGSPAEPRDDNPFVGTWHLTHFDGAPVTASATWSFTETEVTIQASSNTLNGTYLFDSGTNPRTVDLSVVGATPSPNLAIYEFATSATLVLKLMDGAAVRATSFDVQTGYELHQLSKQ